MTYRNGQYEKSGYDLWQTPQHVIDELTEEFGPMFDPCPANWDKSFDGLELDWKGDTFTDRPWPVCFVNPPYSKMKEWIYKCHEEWQKGKTIILLIPPRTDTIAFHDCINGKAEVRFIKGRLKFQDPRIHSIHAKPAPFPSILCIWHAGDTPKGCEWV